MMLIGSPEYIEKENQKKLRITTILEGQSDNIDVDSMKWIDGKFVQTISSTKLMEHIKNKTHEQVFEVICDNKSKADEFFLKNPDKKPNDYYVNIKHKYAVLDVKTAALLVKYFTGVIADFSAEDVV